MTKLVQIALFPLSMIYGLVTLVRNLLFDIGILPSRKFGIPVISVGNLSMGGTGKTPHIEYLVRLLSPVSRVAVLSRGYGRKSKGFMVAGSNSGAKEIGDEPAQFASKFPGILVAVDEKRGRGIQSLLSVYPQTRVVLLDDAFQHRYVKPGLSILLTDYHKLYTEDYLLPSGTLRESRTGAGRADLIVVTKTPKIFSPITRRRILEELEAEETQKVLFSYIRYNDPYPVFPAEENSMPARITSILLFTGIANDYPMREHLERMCSDLTVIQFPDHHPYTTKDIGKIITRFRDLPTQKKIMMTTEKDAVRLKCSEFSNYFKNLPLFCLPMQIEFHGDDKIRFDEAILNYVKKD